MRTNLLQYSLLTFLILSASFGSAIAAINYFAANLQNQQFAARELEAMGCELWYTHDTFSPETHQPQIWRQQLAQWLGDSTVSPVVGVRTGDSDLTDQQLVALGRLPHLKSIHIASCSITDQTLKMLAHLTELKQIDLESPSVSIEGLVQLAKLPKLRYLTLDKIALLPSQREWLEKELKRSNPNLKLKFEVLV